MAACVGREMSSKRLTFHVSIMSVKMSHVTSCTHRPCSLLKVNSLRKFESLKSHSFETAVNLNHVDLTGRLGTRTETNPEGRTVSRRTSYIQRFCYNFNIV
jgi:hypothetical protein